MVRKVISAVAALALAFALVPVVPGGMQEAQAAQKVGQVWLSIEDSTPKRDDMSGFKDPGPVGTIIDPGRVDLYADDTMMSVIVRACEDNGIEVIGAENNYISSIMERAEFDRGEDSGWMGSLNGWYVNYGFNNFSVEAGDLQPGDTIAVSYTTDRGSDLGAGYSDPVTKELGSLPVREVLADGNRGADDLLMPAFDAGTNEYWVRIPASGKVALFPQAANATFQSRMYKDGAELRYGHAVDVAAGDSVLVRCGDPSWPSMTVSSEPATEYTVRFVSSQGLLTDGALVAACANADGEPLAAEVTYADGAYTVVPPMMTDDTALDASTLTLSLPTLPDGAVAELLLADGTQAPCAGNVFDVSGQLGQVARHVDYLTVESGDEVERARVVVDRSAEINPVVASLSLGTDAVPSVEVGPDSFVQTDADGAPTGKQGWDPAHGTYLAVVPATCNTIRLSSYRRPFSCAMDVMLDGKLYWTLNEHGKCSLDAGGSLDMPLSGQGGTLELVFRSRGITLKTYTIAVEKEPIAVAGVIAAIDALPPADDVAYGRDHEAVESVSALMDQLGGEQVAEVSEALRSKLEAVAAETRRQEAAGDDAIADLVGQIAFFSKAIGTRSAPLTDKLYASYGKRVNAAVDSYREMSGWIFDRFDAEHRGEEKVLASAYDLVRKYEITHNMTAGKAYDYIDDFMVSSNAYNLDLGADARAYEITFRDVMYSKPRGGEVCYPFNTPGRVKYEIADESVVGIEEVDTFYTDMGLGGGNAQIRDMRYYLVPKKPGTTTITATTVDETAGTYYGQVPEIIVHVNSSEETAASGDAAGSLAYRLADISERPRSTKYDTWHFLEGTDGADYAFKVSGSDPEVAVWEYLGEGKTSYPVGADGTVTVKLKDGYNPIEVTSTLDGERVTQVYGVRGKAVRYVLKNETRPGEQPRKGDEAAVAFVGCARAIHKISRIYNPVGGGASYSVNLPLISEVKVTTGELALPFELTGAGNVKLTDGYQHSSWWGSPLYSEAAQGNTGEIAPVLEGVFSEFPDLAFEAADNPHYVAPELTGGHAQSAGVVEAGQTATVEVPDLNLDSVLATYPLEVAANDYYNRLREAWAVFSTTIPGVKSIESAHWSSDAESADELSKVKTLSFTVPADTPSGEYQVKGGYVRAYHGERSFGVFGDNLLEKTIGDCTITVVNEKMDAEAVEQVEGAIAAIGKVTDLSQAAAVTAARAAYDAMTERQKSLVGNYQLLLNAERAIEQLKSGKAPDGKPTASKAAKDNAAKAKAAAEAKAKKVKSVTVNAKTVTAKTVAKAIKKAGGKAKYVKTVVLGKKVKKVSKGALKKLKKAKTLVVKTKKLTKKSIKGSLKGSKVKTVRVKVSGSKKANKKYVKKYKKVFTKKNCGKKVKVK